MRYFFLLLLSCLVALPATADFADYVYLPPENKAQTPGLDPAWWSLPRTAHVFNEFAGKTAALQQSATKPGFQVAVEYAVAIAPDDLFAKDTTTVASITSTDALAIRVRVDLGGLAVDDTLWQLDPASGVAFGPYRMEDGTLWLPILAGAEALLAIESPSGTAAVQVLNIAHFYEDPFATLKQVPCPVSVACADDETVQEVSTATGLLFIPVVGIGVFQCSGTLLNAPGTDELEPYFISAHHCFDGDVDVPGIEVVWDYRADACEGGATTPVAKLPRSRGTAILAENVCLDGEFIELDTVPVGDLGRAWLGWDSREPLVGETGAVIHHPAGSPLKISQGPVTELDITACFNAFCSEQGIRQTQLRYDTGITQQGSSGSGALYVSQNYRLFGMLSNGPVHNCDNPAGNLDHFASFQDFYPEVQPWLNPGGTAGNRVVCVGQGGINCPAKAAFGEAPAVLASLRKLRDTVVVAAPAAQAWVDAYYAQAPQMAAVVESSEEARSLFSAVALPLAMVGYWLPNT